MTNPAWVRVRDERTGAHISVPRSVYERNQKHYRELKVAAVDCNGRPLAPHFPQPKADEAKAPTTKGKN